MVVKIGDEKANNSKDKHDSPILFKNGKADRRNSGNDHDIKEKVACPGEKEVVCIFLLNGLFPLEELHCFLNKGCRKNAQEEVESEDEGGHSRKNLRKHSHNEIRNHIGDNDERNLYGHFIDAFLHRDFVVTLNFLVFSGFACLVSDDSFSLEDVEMNNAADACTEESKGRDGKSKALSAFKTEVVFINSAIVHGLTGSLSVSERKKDSRRLEEIRNEERRSSDCDNHSADRLEKIGGNGGNTGVKNLGGSFLRDFSVAGFKGRCNKTKGKAVIGEHFKGLCAGSTKKRRIEHDIAGDELIDPGNNNKDSSAENGNRNQRIFKKSDGFFKNIAYKKACKKHSHNVKRTPDTIVPEIFHFRFLPLYFSICNRYSRI